MSFAVFLRENVPADVVDGVLRLGLTTPEICYAFLVNNPLMVKRDTAVALGLERWLVPGGEASLEEIRNSLISLLERSGVLAPNYLNMKNRQRARLMGAPLGTMVEPAIVEFVEGPPTREAVAKDIVEVVEQTAAEKDPPPDRSLPHAGIDLRLRPGPTIPWPVRDQRPTPSCTAFAVAAALELQLARQLPMPPPGKRHPAPERLSARFLYREARRLVLNDPIKAAKPAYKGGGLKQEDVAAVLKAQGVPTEALYRDKFERADWADTIAVFDKLTVSQNAAEEVAAKTDALTRKHGLQVEDFPDYRKRQPGMARKVFDHLQQGNPVVVCIPGFSEPKDPNIKGSGESNIWHDEHFWDTGLLPLPPPHYIVGKPGHAVCVVGYLAVVNAPQQKFPNYHDLSGFFMFRNSWGAQYFARNSPIMEPVRDQDFDFPRGYGLIPAVLMEYFVWEYGIVKPIP
jgi:hypothetical protein